MNISFAHARITQGGAERAIASLAGSFAEKGHAVTIYTFDAGRETYYTLDPRVRLIPIPRGRVRGIRNIGIMLRMRRNLRQSPQDVVLTFATRTLFLAVLAAAGMRTRVLYSERSNPKVYPASRMWRAIRTAMVSLCDGLVLQTNAAAKVFARQAAKSIVIPNALFNQAVYAIKPPAVREPVIASMGRFIESKGFQDIIEILASLPPAFDGYHLALYGANGGYRPALEAQIASAGLSDRVSLITGDENAIAHIATASAFVFASYREGMPNALMEAMAVGLPCIAYDCEMGPSDLLEDGVNGFLVPVGDKALLRARLLQLLEAPALGEQLGRRAMEVRERYAVERVAEAWLAFIREGAVTQPRSKS